MAQQDLTYLLSEQARLLADIANINAQLLYARANANQQIVAGLEQRLASAQELLSIVQSQIQTAGDSALPTVSAGQVVAGEQNAKAPGAVVQNPSIPAGTETVTANVVQSTSDIETGTNSRVRPLVETQSTPQPEPQPFATRDDYDNPLPPTPSLNAGVGARPDDSPGPTANGTAQIINASFSQRITPQPNILDQYASYTYAISWYLLTPDQYNEMTVSQKRNCASWQLLVQSGGAPVTASAGVVGIRNQFFNQDYYLDDLEIDSVIPLKGTGAANTATDIRFKITEPNGISLLQNLYKAVSTLYKQQNVAKTPNYPMAQYCLAVRFYGYNEAGELAQVGTAAGGNTPNANTNSNTDKRAVVEKFYPFVISNIRFKVTNKMIEYELLAKPIPHFYNKSQDRGTIPFAFELVGETVSELLIGKPVGTQYPREDGRATSPSPSQAGPQRVSTPSVETITSVDQIQYDQLGNPIGSY